MRYETLIHHGFHGRTHLRFRPGRRHVSSCGGACFEVSEVVAKRLNRAICGVPGCTCCASIAFQAVVADSCNPAHGCLDYHGPSDRWFVYVPTNGEVFDRYADR